MVENSTCDFLDIDETNNLNEIQPEELDMKLLERKVASVSFGQIKVATEEDEEEGNLDEESSGNNSSPILKNSKSKKKAIDGTSNTAFRNFYVRELQQLDQIGKQIKSLQHLAQRYDVLKPYLKKIEDLQNVDFSQPDPEIDSHIEHCSGWNVDIEFQKGKKTRTTIIIIFMLKSLL